MPLWLVGSLAAALASNAAATKAGSRGGLLEKRTKPLALMPLSRHVTKAGQTPQTTQAPLVGDIKFPFADENGKSDVLESVWPAEAPAFSPTTKTTTTTTSIQPLKAPAPAPPPCPPATIIHNHQAPAAATPELRTLAAAAAGAADQAMQAAAVASAGGAAGGGGSASGVLAGAVSASQKADQALAAAEAAQQEVKSLRDSLRSAAEARARELMKLGGVSSPR